MVHQQQDWIKEAEASAANRGYSQILNGGYPAACLKYPEDDVPEEVGEDDPNFYRKNKDREDIIRQNVKNAKLRQQVVLDFQNKLYYAIYKACKPHGPYIGMKIEAECEYDDPLRQLPVGKWFDGAKAFRLVVQTWNQLSRTRLLGSGSHTHSARCREYATVT